MFSEGQAKVINEEFESNIKKYPHKLRLKFLSMNNINSHFNETTCSKDAIVNELQQPQIQKEPLQNYTFNQQQQQAHQSSDYQKLNKLLSISTTNLEETNCFNDAYKISLIENSNYQRGKCFIHQFLFSILHFF